MNNNTFTTDSAGLRARAEMEVIGETANRMHHGNVAAARHHWSQAGKRDAWEIAVRTRMKALDGSGAALLAVPTVERASGVPSNADGWRYLPRQNQFLSPSGHCQSERQAKLVGVDTAALKRAGGGA